MERREVTQYKVFVLSLPNVRGGKASPVAIFSEKAGLIDFYNDELAEKEWTDDNEFDMQGVTISVHKYFKKGSILEWCMPIISPEGKHTIGLDYETLEYEDSYNMGSISEEWITGYPKQEMFTAPYNPGLEPMVVEYEEG